MAAQSRVQSPPVDEFGTLRAELRSEVKEVADRFNTRFRLALVAVVDAALAHGRPVREIRTAVEDEEDAEALYLYGARLKQLLERAGGRAPELLGDLHETLDPPTTDRD
jgi:hypothetical protein